VRASKIDIVLLDINLPDTSGFDVARTVLQIAPNTAIIMMSLYKDADKLREVAEVGAKAYVCKADIVADLISALRAVRKNETFFK
jgi:DNA-binding NarL/FixJ family response regulator